MDLQMPVMDGLEATRRIRSSDLFKSIIIIGCSANSDDETVQDAFDAGIKYIIKSKFYTIIIMIICILLYRR